MTLDIRKTPLFLIYQKLVDIGLSVPHLLAVSVHSLEDLSKI
jgi:hypothetical protein